MTKTVDYKELDVDPDDVGLRVREEREKRGWSQQELCRRLGVNAETAGKWERGLRLPSTDHLLMLAKLFRVPVDYILHGAAEEQGESVISEGLDAFFDSPQGQALNSRQRLALAKLLHEQDDVDEWRIRAAVDTLFPTLTRKP